MLLVGDGVFAPVVSEAPARVAAALAFTEAWRALPFAESTISKPSSDRFAPFFAGFFPTDRAFSIGMEVWGDDPVPVVFDRVLPETNWFFISSLIDGKIVRLVDNKCLIQIPL